MIEKIIVNILAIGLFTATFLKLIRKNDTSYIYVLGMEFIGIFLNFIELIFLAKLPIVLKILAYLFSIIIPILLLWVEKSKKIDFPELFNVSVAKILVKLGKEDFAKDSITKFLSKNPNSYNAHKLLAEFYEKKGNYEAAISEYIRVTDLRKKDWMSFYKLSECFNKNKQNEQAIEVLQEILKQKPDFEKATNLLGEVFFEQERYKEAAGVYMAALRYHPGSYDLYYSLGMTYTMINDFQKAKEFYEKAAEINSMAYNANLNLGQIALIYGDLEKAENYFRQSAKNEDLEAGSYYYLSQIAILKGDEEKATNYMNIAVELDAKIYKQAQRDPVFTPIRNEINPPVEVVRQEIEKTEETISKKEKSVNRHLMKTCILVGNLSNEDLKVMRKHKQNQKEKEEKQK